MIAIGIDTYQVESMRLDGAAAYAERLAKWALRQRIPAENILLACSHAGAAPEPPPRVARLEPTYSNIMGMLTGAATHDAELLLMYWCGHGVLNNHGERALFTSDAYIGARFNHAVNDMLLYLGSDRVVGLRRQIFIIDSCANYIQDMHLGDRLPQSPSLDIGDPRAIDQYVLYSASQGQPARHNRVTGLNAFSDTVFEWLEEMPADRIDPDTSVLTENVTAVFDKLRATSADFRQRPATVRIAGTAGADRTLFNAGGIPVSGARFRDITGNGLDILHTRHAAESHRRLAEWWAVAGAKAAAGGPRPDVRRALIAALHESEFEGGANNLDANALIVRIFGAGRVARLFELLQEYATTETLELGLIEIHTLWNQEADLAVVEQYFPGVTRKMVADSYRWSAPAGRSGWPSGLTEALHDLAGLPPVAGLRPLHRFVAALEVATGRMVADSWFGVSGDQLRAVRSDAARPYLEHGRLVIEIPNAARNLTEFEWPSGVREHRYTPGRGWKNQWHGCDPTAAAVQEQVNLIAGDDTFALGFLLPRAVFDSFPESWQSSTNFRDPAPHWSVRPVMLHSAERRQYEPLRTQWARRHAAIRSHLENHPDDLLNWVEQLGSGQIDHLVRSCESACVGLAFVPPDYTGMLRQDPLFAAIRAGAPYILWTTNRSADWPTVQRLVDELVRERAFDELPALLHSRRRRKKSPEAEIRLLWDDPDVVPEAPYFPGMRPKAE